MNNQDKEQFSKIMLSVAEVFEKEMTKMKLMVYFSALQDLTIEQVQEGVNKHLRDTQAGTFMPKPSDILKQVNGTERAAQEQLEGTAQMQWMNVTHAISRCGRYRTPNFKDPYTRAAVTAMGGWSLFCDLSNEQLNWKGKEFVKTYQSMVTKPIDQLPNNVQGLEDLQKTKMQAADSLENIQKKLNEMRKG